MPRKPMQAPLTLKCPVGGEEWPTSSFRSFVRSAAEKVLPKDISISCPAGHAFNLGIALREKIISQRAARNIRTHASRLVAEERAKRREI